MTARPCDACRSQQGISLLECALALAVSAIAMTGVGRALEMASSIVRHAHASWFAMDAARMTLEHVVGAPCAGLPPCPAPYRCTISRSTLGGGLERIAVEVTAPSLSDPLRLHTMTRVASCTPG